MSPFNLGTASGLEDPDDAAEAVLSESATEDDANIPEPVHWSKILGDVWSSIESGEAPAVIPTPFPHLNEVLDGGFRKQELVLVGARSTVGKSSLIGQFAVSAAKAGQTVILANLEMSDQLAVRRMLVQQARVFATAVRRNTVDDYDKARIRTALPELSPLPVYVTDEATSIRQLVKMVARFSKTHAVGMVLFDYLQLIAAPKAIRDRRLQVEYVSRTLRRLAIKFNVCVVCVSALRRLQKDEEPGMDALKESGDLEYGADVVIVLTRERGQRETKCVVAKQRNGQDGQVELVFEWEFTRFQEG